MPDMRRRAFISLLGGAAAWPFAGFAQTPPRPVVACLIGGSKAGTERFFVGFLQGMRELGYMEGHNWVFESRYADGDQARAPLLAEELVRLKPDVLVSGTMAGVIAFKTLTNTIPIVSPVLIDPVGFGLAASHAQPGGSVTGVLLTVEDLPSKQLALAVEMIPSARKIGLLVNPGNPTHAVQRRNVEVAATALGIELVTLEVRVPEDLHAAFENLARESIMMVLVLADTMFLNERKRIALLAVAARLPTMFGLRQNVEDGGLMSYGIEIRENWRRTAAFVGKILRGARPGDLPMEFPTKLELVINVTAAKVLGLTIPPMLLARADEVIE
jgi:putative tryptophan/tyrosine transport system substrate-binding protein